MPNTPRLYIAPRLAAWQELRQDTDTVSDVALAARLKFIDRRTVGRVMSGETMPSNEFVAASLAAFRSARFERLFTIVTAQPR